MALSSVALIHKGQSALEQHRLSVFKDALERHDIECRFFRDSDNLMDSGYTPDCVLTLGAQEAKLTPFPTYGILDKPPSQLLPSKYCERNMLMYDAYLSSSPVWDVLIDDLIFSAYKTGACREKFFIAPSGRHRKPVDFGKARIAYISDDFGNLRNMPVFRKRLLLSGHMEMYNFSRTVRPGPRGMHLHTIGISEAETVEAYAQCGIGLDFFACDDAAKIISFDLLEIIASGAIAITNQSDYLQSLFGDSLLYIPMNATQEECQTTLKSHVENTRNDPTGATLKADTAYSICKQSGFFNDAVVEKLKRLHDKALIRQGYTLQPSSPPSELPRVSYIMRTGGDPAYITQTLDSLVAQSYPHIQVILVLYKPLTDQEKLINKYQHRLTFKVVEDFDGLRSTGIVTGMRHVDTDYFGLLDDDDVIHPNHVASLLRAIRTHSGSDWRGEIRLAYSGSYLASDEPQFSETSEYHDESIHTKPYKRVVEHFQFHDIAKMASHHWYMMSNSWLAHRSLINERLLDDPHTHSHEDLYFELQFALQTHFAFSAEMTAVHWMHGNNSTIVDKSRHAQDSLHHMLRLQYTVFPVTKTYRAMAQELPLGIHLCQNGIVTIATQPGARPRYLHSPLQSLRLNAPYLSVLVRQYIYYIRVKGVRVATRRALEFILTALSRSLRQ